MNPSIRRRLLVALLSATTVTWTLTALFSYLDIRYQVDQLFDAQLAQSARVLLALNTVTIEQKVTALNKTENPELPGAAERLFGHRYENKLAFQVWLQPDTLLLRSPNAPLAHLTNKEYGFRDQELEGHLWRVFSLPDDQSAMLVQVGERHDVRVALIHNIALRTMMPILIALPLLALVIWFGIGRALLPLTKLARQVEHRAASYLHPVESYGVPREAKSLVDALNNLFHRLERAFDSERRFTSDAAHELRTPLAGLKTQTQVALRSTNEQNRQRALKLLEVGVDRATHLVQQLLTLARLDPDHGLTEKYPVALHDLVTAAQREQLISAQEKNVELRCGTVFRHTVAGHADALAILLRNLVDNAIRYAPEGGIVEIGMEQVEGGVAVSVSDSGPGIAPDERDKVFKRFYRSLGTTAPGSGLGLSIVQRIAELHHARIALNTSTFGGLRVDVIFPPESA